MKNKEISSVKYSRRNDLITYGILVALFVLFQLLSATGHISRSTSGQLVPVCVYVVAAIALNLVCGISGELSLGHAGFLSIGAFSGVVFYTCSISSARPFCSWCFACCAPDCWPLCSAF